MHNQAVNSLALISVRYTSQAAELVSMMAAAHLFVLCQALDLRAMIANFFLTLKPKLDELNHRTWSESMETDAFTELNRVLWQHIITDWSSNSKFDSHDRAVRVAEASLSVLTTYLIPMKPNTKQPLLDKLAVWKTEAQATIFEVYISNRSEFFKSQNTTALLGRGSKAVYLLIRHELGVPFHQGLIEHPHHSSKTLDGREKKNIGSWISIIHESIRNGQLYRSILDLKRGDGAAQSLDTTTSHHSYINGNDTTSKRDLVNGGPQRRETPKVLTRSRTSNGQRDFEH